MFVATVTIGIVYFPSSLQDADQSEVNVYSSVDYAAFKDKGPEITAVFEDSDVTVPFSALQGPLDSSIRSVPSPNKSKNISDIVRKILFVNQLAILRLSFYS